MSLSSTEASSWTILAWADPSSAWRNFILACSSVIGTKDFVLFLLGALVLDCDDPLGCAEDVDNNDGDVLPVVLAEEDSSAGTGREVVYVVVEDDMESEALCGTNVKED